MSSIPLLLQNDHVLYGALAQLDALSGQAFPSKEQLLWQTGLAEDALIQALERLCQQKILQKVPDGAYTVFSRPLYLHYHNFHSFGQRLVRCAVLVFQ